MVREGKDRKGVILGWYLLLGLLLIAYSIVAFLAELRGGTEPLFLLSSSALQLLLVALGAILLRTAWKFGKKINFVNMLVGLFLVIFGALPIALELGLSRVLPYTLDLKTSVLMLTLVLFFSSLYFIVDLYLEVFKNEYS